MIVSGLKCDASTSRSRNWLADHRFPAPASDGARSPWNWVPNGPEWQRMHVVLRSSINARPCVASPAAPVSGCGMPSPTILYGASVCASAAQSRRAAASAQTIWRSALAKIIRRDVLEPIYRFLRFSRPHLVRRVDCTGNAALDLGEDAVLRHVDAGQ